MQYSLYKLSLIIVLCCHAGFAYSQLPNVGDPACDSLLLVSSWKRNNVKIYDGCSGQYIRNLDSQNLINGPLAILQAPDKDVLVVSETNHRLLKFDYQTLSKGRVILGDDPDTKVIEDNFIQNPVSAVMAENDVMYAASYTTNEVVKINTQHWQITKHILPANNGHIKGIDVGMQLHNNALYLPGYDSDNIIKLNLVDNTVTQVVAPGTAGLDASRSILFVDQLMYVSAERSNKIMLFDITGQFKRTLLEISRPAGMQHDTDQHFLVNTADAVFRVKNDASSYQKIIQNGSGDLAGATFVFRLYKSASTFTTTSTITTEVQ